jgi:sulfite reductase (NADPH) flavoprotein alpha-component
LYSIASSKKYVGDELHLTVARVRYTIDGREKRGICSHFLCDLAAENVPTVPVYLQQTRDFRLPIDDKVPIIMIGPGTGVAPFRAFMQERISKNAHSGKNWLFFGERNRATDFFYEEYWTELVSSGILRLDTAFSRDQQEKVYVQNRMWDAKEEFWKWLQDGAIIYVCGDASHMAKDVDLCLHKIVESEGKLDATGARDYVKVLRHEKRYIRDVY